MPTCYPRAVLLFALLLAPVLARAAEEQPKPPADEWAYLDNGKLRLGVKKSSGGAIAYLSRAGSDRNVINHYDRGRLVQQSYYGQKDDSLWNKQPWRWNPVQGGDWKGAPATLLEFKVDGDTKLYAKTRPKHWADGTDIEEVLMEQWITLDGDVAHVRFKMTYTGKESHPVMDQEIPAFFTEPDLDTLVLYDGDHPWTGGEVSRSKPGWPNESRKIAEHWAAYVDRDDFGVGAYVPAADRITCYRFGDGGKDACSYFAPLKRFAIEPGTVFEYDLYVTIGTSREIRERFTSIAKAKDQPDKHTPNPKSQVPMTNK